ncbi:beta-galactosidase [Cerasicoccus frondis]|uniref:beta-galactosidase n=1 Tax=Cerasicoccus frondis TaxID=490090 RepID=UPI00285298ED|nr:beta-galactosidase [Cerasicoccus frondis]
MSVSRSVESLPLKCLPVGAVLLIERNVPLAELRRDLENMVKLGFNTVVVYPSVSRWEAPSPGQTAFGAIDAVMDCCAELGLKVVLELQGQVMQDADAPECFGYAQSVDYRENGFHQPQKEALVEQYLREVSMHFKGHPALMAYDIFNEIGNCSRSPETIQAFVRYLERQYKGDIQLLNAAWATYFASFDDINRTPPNYRVWSWSSVVAERDWQRFRSVDFTEQLHWWRSIIREIDPDTPLFADVLGSDVLHNRTGDYFGASDWDVVAASDVHGLSCYANMLGKRWWESDAWLWPQFWRHALSVADGKQTIISELMTQNRSLFPTENSSMTDELGLWSYQAIFHGIQGLIYWKYRPFRRGRQVAGRGLTDFDGTPNHFAEQAGAVAEFMQKHASVLAESTPDDSGCGIVFDPDVERLLTAIGDGEATTPPGTRYTDDHRGWFHAFWREGVCPRYLAPQCIAESGIPTDMKVLVVPCLPALTERFANSLKAFMQHGGIVVSDARFGVLDIDGNLQCRVPGFDLHDLLGIEERDFVCRGKRSVTVSDELLVLDDDYFQAMQCESRVEIILRTDDGLPALMRAKVGNGYYVHAPFLLGHQVEQSECNNAALAYFKILFDLLRPALSPTIQILEKGPLTDVSVLLNSEGKPWHVGITNFSPKADRIRLTLQTGQSLVMANQRIEERDDQVFVSVKGRSSLSLLVE